MKFPVLASCLLIFIFVINRAINRSNKQERRSEADFWQKENTANDVRKQSLDGLDYLDFSAERISPAALLDAPSRDSLMDEGRVLQLMDAFSYLEKEKKVNLNYLTNTELKAAYGVANLPALTAYDQNYTELITLLQEYAALLAQKGYILPALTVLETALEAGSDISSTYSLAASIYKEQGQEENIKQLLDRARKLQSPRKTVILRVLEGLLAKEP